jgi:hypothetical protein
MKTVVGKALARDFEHLTLSLRSRHASLQSANRWHVER